MRFTVLPLASVALLLCCDAPKAEEEPKPKDAVAKAEGKAAPDGNGARAEGEVESATKNDEPSVDDAKGEADDAKEDPKASEDEDEEDEDEDDEGPGLWAQLSDTAEQAKQANEAKAAESAKAEKKRASTVAATYEAPGTMVFEPPEAGDGKLPHDLMGAVDPEEGTMMDHPDEFGWNADSTTFVYCWTMMGAEFDICEFLGTDGKVERLDGDGRKKRKKLGKRRSEGPWAKGPVKWRYGKDITFVWSEKNYKVRVGGKLKSGEHKSNAIVFKFDPELIDGGMAFLELVSLSPDGNYLALVAHGNLGEIENDFKAQIVPTGEFAAQIYKSAGFKHLKKGKHADAAKFFEKATGASSRWKHPYNLACARAQAGSGDVEAALKLAIERGGDKVKRKAAKDEDLEPVRGEAWFTKLIGA